MPPRSLPPTRVRYAQIAGNRSEPPPKPRPELEALRKQRMQRLRELAARMAGATMTVGIL